MAACLGLLLSAVWLVGEVCGNVTPDKDFNVWVEKERMEYLPKGPETPVQVPVRVEEIKEGVRARGLPLGILVHAGMRRRKRMLVLSGRRWKATEDVMEETMDKLAAALFKFEQEKRGLVTTNVFSDDPLDKEDPNYDVVANLVPLLGDTCSLCDKVKLTSAQEEWRRGRADKIEQHFKKSGPMGKWVFHLGRWSWKNVVDLGKLYVECGVLRLLVEGRESPEDRKEILSRAYDKEFLEPFFRAVDAVIGAQPLSPSMPLAWKFVFNNSGRENFLILLDRVFDEIMR